MPMSRKLCCVIAQVTSRMLGYPVQCALDWDEHSTVQQVRNERIAAATALWDRGMSWEAVNDYLCLGMQEFEGWDVGRLSFGLTEVGAELKENPLLSPQFGEPTEDEDTKADPIEEAKSALRKCAFAKVLDRPQVSVSGVPVTDGECCRCSEDIEPISKGFTPEQRGIEEKKRAQWLTLMAQRRKSIKTFSSKFTKLIFDARSEVLANIESKGDNKAVVTRAAAADFIFNLSNWKAKFIFEMRNIAHKTLDIAGKQLMEEVGNFDPWKMPPPAAIKYLNQRDNLLSLVTDDVYERMNGSLQEGLNAGESKKELADRVRAVSNDISKGRADVIAQTETSAAYGYARQAAMSEAGINYKGWLSSRNSKVRPSHAQADQDYFEHPIPINEPFIVGGFAMMHPGDQGAPPAVSVNCFCVQVAARDPGE
jgi:hypothetical protein